MKLTEITPIRILMPVLLYITHTLVHLILEIDLILHLALGLKMCLLIRTVYPDSTTTTLKAYPQFISLCTVPRFLKEKDRDTASHMNIQTVMLMTVTRHVFHYHLELTRPNRGPQAEFTLISA